MLVFIPCLAAYILHLILHFVALSSLHPSTLMFLLTGVSLYTRLQIQCSLRLCEPHTFCSLWSREMHVSVLQKHNSLLLSAQH